MKLLRNAGLAWMVVILQFACTRQSDPEGAAPGGSLPQAAFSTTAPYAVGIPMSSSTSGCNLEAINHEPFGVAVVAMTKTSPLIIAGWAYDELAVRRAASLHVVLIDAQGRPRYFGKAEKSVPRPDVAAHIKRPDLVDLGFEAAFSLSAVDEGVYRVVLYIGRAAGVASCDVGRTISITG